MHQLAELAQRRVIAEGPARYIAGVEFFHMAKPAKTVKVVTHGQLPPRDTLLQRYAGIRQGFRNPLFQATYLLAALREEPWFVEFDTPLACREWSFFVHSTQEKHRTTPAMIGFAWEASRLSAD